MDRSIRCLLFALLLIACRDAGHESGRTRTPDVTTRTGSAQLEDNEAGVEYEAPRLIPAIRAQITQIREAREASEGNLTAYRNGVGTLVNAMTADLNRMGVTNSGYFHQLSDSIMRALGGGAGSVPDISPEEARQSTAQVERLIGMYEERMRNAR